MSRSAVVGVVALAVLPLLACSKSDAPAPIDELRAAIEEYRGNKPAATEERITALFARLDADIAARRAAAAAEPAATRNASMQQVATLERDRRDLQQAWITARLARVGTTAGEALRGLGESLGRGIEDAGRRLRESLDRGATPEPPTPEAAPESAS